MKNKSYWVIGLVCIVLATAAGLYFVVVAPSVSSSVEQGKNWCGNEEWNINIDRWVGPEYELVGPKSLEELPKDVRDVAVIEMYGTDACSMFHSNNSIPRYAEERIEDMGVEIWAYSILRWGPEPMIATLGAAKALGNTYTARSDTDLVRFPGGIEETVELWAKALSTATDSDQTNHISPEWTTQLLEVGRAKLRFENQNTDRVDYGWSIFAPLLRQSDYPTDFLATVSIDILKFDKKSNWVIDETQSDNPYDDESPGKLDPVAPVLDALNANKDAAKKVAEATGDERVEKLLAE